MRSGKPVGSARTTQGKTRVLLSTIRRTARTLQQQVRVKPVEFPYFTPNFTQHFSPLKIAFSPLVEHYFYPVSTGPINNSIKGKLKKGNK
jgi:hypothetical protein